MQNVEDNCTNPCSLPRPINYLLLLTFVHVRCCKKKVIQYILHDDLNTDMNSINNLKPRAVTFSKSVKFKTQKKRSPSLTVTIFPLSVSFSVTISVTIAMPFPLTASLPVIVIVTISTTWFVAPTFFSWPTVVPLSGSLTSSKRNYFINFFFKILVIPTPVLYSAYEYEFDQKQIRRKNPFIVMLLYITLKISGTNSCG